MSAHPPPHPSEDDPSKLDLAGRTVAITGSTGGLGSALADALRVRKANLVLLDLNHVAVTAQAERLGGERVAVAIQTDVRDMQSLEDALSARRSSTSAGWTSSSPARAARRA